MTSDYRIKKLRNVATLDASKLIFPLTLRVVQTADRFVPFGMKGSKLLSDYMTDRKFSVFAKRSQLVITDAEERIVWVVNERPDNRFCITSDTKSVIELSL